jgi:hypothetical protein
MQNDWSIQSRSEKCAVTGREFREGEHFYTLLYRDRHGFRREDLSEEAWAQRRASGDKERQPFSFWRSKFEPPPPPAPEPLAKETAEDLLRRYMQENDMQHANARYILALMLERKRLLKQIDAQQTSEGRTLIYEHTKTGEIFVIPDPQLRLDQIEQVQMEVAALLGR